MSSSVKNGDVSQFEEQVTPNKHNTVEPYVEEDLPGVLESSGGSSELQAPHLQASTVTFTGVPPSPSIVSSVPQVEVEAEIITNAYSSAPVDVACMSSNDTQ